MSDKPSRRSVLHGLLATGALCSTPSFAASGSLMALSESSTAPGTPEPSAGAWILLGTGKGPGITRARWNPETGEIGAPELAIAASRPSYLALHPRLPVLYCCNEDDVPAAAVSAFTLDRASAILAPLSSAPTEGSAPCFVSLDPSGRLLFAANYSGGSLAAFPVDATGKPSPTPTVFTCAGKPAFGTSGPVKDRQEGPHLHCATLSPDHRFVIACNLGGDTILVFPIHPGSSSPLGTPTVVHTKAGAGPRHVAFHPNGRWMYCINELDCTVVPYRWQADGPSLQPVPGATVSILPPHAPEPSTSTGAEIVLTRDGRFAYTSTRFTDVLTVFAVDAVTGKLQQLQQLPCGGKMPRFFALDPGERWLVCGNQDADTLTVFARDAHTGQLTPHASYPATNPQCILWL